MSKADEDMLCDHNDEMSLLIKKCDYIFSENSAIMLIFDPENGRIIDANKSAIEFYQYPKEKFLSMTIFEINILPHEEIMSRLTRFKEKQRLSFVINHKLADGTIKTVRVQSSKITIDNNNYIFSAIYDNSEDEGLENEHTIINKQLKDSLTFNQNLIKNASEGIIVYDKELRYTVWNDYMVKASGLPASEVLGKSTSSVFAKDTYLEVIDGLKRALKGETVTLESIEFINPITKISGYTREVYSPNFDSDGEIIGVVCMVSDITNIVKFQKSLAKKNVELYKLNQILSKNMKELKIAKEKAEESDRLKSSFLALISHEIRTPLNSIVGFSSLLRNVRDSNKISEYVDIIQSNNLFLLNIIDDILTYSLIETSSISLNLVDVDVVVFLKELFNSFKQIPTDAIAFTLNIGDASSLIIHTDENKLNQIISNLLTNAFKFTNSGTIEFGIDSYDSNKIVLYVKDSGIGINADNHEIIFSRFHKINSIKPGCGLGLSICRALCEMIKGKITLKSKLNEGSTFYIELPMKF